MKFGFLIDKKEFNCSDFSISTVSDYKEIISRFFETAHVSNGWVYGPERELKQSNNEKKKFKKRGPINCENFYRRVGTHEIKTNDDNEDYQRFLILAYGFLQGLYLTPESYSYLGRVPYEPGKLNGLLLSGSDYVTGMKEISRFYKSSTQKQRNQMFASIHWFLIGQSYSFEWDIFDAQYKVLDGIYKLSGVKANNHAGRLIELAKKYGIVLPRWADLDSSGKMSTLSKHRNELVHEAKYGGHPIGYSYPTENYRLEFTSFNTKLIISALGINTPYLKAEPTNCCQWGWDIKT